MQKSKFQMGERRVTKVYNQPLSHLPFTIHHLPAPKEQLC